jgi:hypothetical protein
MSRLFVAIASFTAGVCAAAVVIGSGSSTLAQNMAIRNTPAIPVVPPGPVISLHNVAFSTIGGNDGVQQLDGLRCDGCRFDDAVLTYGGGNFELKNVTISGTARLQLTGAAANTVALIDALESIGLDSNAILPNLIPQRPINKTVTIKKPTRKLDLRPPFTGTLIGNPKP